MNKFVCVDQLQLMAQLQWQSQKLIELEGRVNSLSQELLDLKNRRQIHVDKIEYKFDQLKVETLEGTLNIGISPGGGKPIEELLLGDQEVDLSQPLRQEAFQSIKDDLDGYMNSECLREIQFFEDKHGVILGPNYRQEMLKDLWGQMDQRIHVYLDAIPPGNDAPGQKALICEKVRRDIQLAIEQHVLSRKMGRESE